MLTLRTDQVVLGTAINNKNEAISHSGQILVDTGLVKPEYIDSMLKREASLNTYIGNGLAFPHADPSDRHLIIESGLSLLQIPDGVEWTNGETVTIVVGIAAQGDEHLRTLRRLTRILSAEEQVVRLTETDDPLDVVEIITGRRPSGPAAQPVTDSGFDQSVDVTIVNPSGLHARPAALLVKVANQFQADIRLRHNDVVADGKGILTVLQLNAQQGDKITMLARGIDAEAALAALQDAVVSSLGEV